MKNLNIFVLSNDDLTSNLIFSELFNNLEVHISGLAFTGSPAGRKQKGNLQGAFALLKKMSFRYWLYLVFTNGLFKVYEFLHRRSNPENLRLLRNLAQFNRVPVQTVDNFNEESFCNHLRNLEIDLLVIRVNQILRRPILNIPKIGVICVHSSLLPSYGGIAAEFHALRRGDQNVIGTSIFKVEEKLDSGDTLDQRAISPQKKNSCFGAMIENNLLGANLLKDYIDQVVMQRRLPASHPFADLTQSYFSWPQPEHLKELYQRGFCLISFKEALNYLRICFGSAKSFDSLISTNSRKERN